MSETSGPSTGAASTGPSAPTESSGHHAIKGPLLPIAVAALGVVYGDIGTSPLYALRECFTGPHGVPINEVSVLGILSLVFWVLIITISIKYMLFVLRADNRGEGGILALTALACPRKAVKKSVWLMGIGVFGAALLYGDGVITPAISVLSAVEGLNLATPFFKPYIIPITCGILACFFAVQKHGTGRIGAVFGPVMLVWFFTLAALGVIGICDNPMVLKAVNPMYALDFIIYHKMESYFVMGSLFLVVTGGEALYADMGHFGKKPIQWAWFTVALPALILNYFGQGAHLLLNPETADNPFYNLAPPILLYPLIILSTFATIIASQALISGVYSLTQQAIHLGLCPRLQIVHTSSKEIGQIYIPQVNWAIFLGTIWLVIVFKSSSGLAAAYGISVSATMVITTVLMYVVARKIWGWSLLAAAPLMAGFLVIDFVFLSANAIKISQGGYVTILIGIATYTLMVTWRRGREILAERLRNSVIQMSEFLQQIHNAKLARVPGVAIFMVGDPMTTPPALIHNVKHNKVIHETVLILTILTKDIPVIPASERLRVEKIEEHFYRIIAVYGFMDQPDVMEVIAGLKDRGLKVPTSEITFFLGRENVIATDRPGMAIWREHIFSYMQRNAQRATAYFNIPADQVVELGIQIEL